MLKIDLRTNMAALVSDLNLERTEIRRAAQRGINAAARGMVTDTVRTLRDRYPKLKASDIRSFMDVRYASADNLTATVIARGRPLGLSRFVLGVDRKRGGGVRVQIKDGAKMIPHAFVAKGRDFGDAGRSTVVFIRGQYKGILSGGKSEFSAIGKAGREQIVALRTFNVPDAMNIVEVRATLNALSNERFDNEFVRQIRLISGPKNFW